MSIWGSEQIRLPATLLPRRHPISTVLDSIMRAKIEWIPRSQGGRSRPPSGIGSSADATVVRFVDDPWPPLDVAWSLVVEKISALSTEYQWIANVRFLVEQAPHESLREGRRFELYEGGKLVAYRIINDNQWADRKHRLAVYANSNR